MICFFILWTYETYLALELLLKNKRLENEKTGQSLSEESLSGELPETGLEPAPSRLE